MSVENLQNVWGKVNWNTRDISVDNINEVIKQQEEIYDALVDALPDTLQKFFFQTPLEEVYETIVGVDGMERYTHEELLKYIKGLKING